MNLKLGSWSSNDNSFKKIFLSFPALYLNTLVFESVASEKNARFILEIVVFVLFIFFAHVFVLFIFFAQIKYLKSISTNNFATIYDHKHMTSEVILHCPICL